jgi:hypothetical protein
MPPPDETNPGVKPDPVSPPSAPVSSPPPAAPAGDEAVLRLLRRSSRRSFLVAAAAAVAGGSGWYWLRSTSDIDGVSWPLRRMLQFNERLGRALFSDRHLAPTFPAGEAAVGEDMRVNGMVGLESPLDAARWELRVTHSDGRPPLRLALADLRALPATTTVTELKCVEGWSQVLSWTGVTLRDFVRHYRLGTRSGAAADLAGGRDDLYRFASMETPDGKYYVGLDMPSVLHPQTLLCYEMGGQPLTADHGAPLRLAMPVKYGYKCIKRIAKIHFTDAQPRDYWAERAYDWYAGL